MQNEERVYQKFLVKTIKIGKEFIDDYNNLSEQNTISARFVERNNL